MYGHHARDLYRCSPSESVEQCWRVDIIILGVLKEDTGTQEVSWLKAT